MTVLICNMFWTSFKSKTVEALTLRETGGDLRCSNVEVADDP